MKAISKVPLMANPQKTQPTFANKELAYPDEGIFHDEGDIDPNIDKDLDYYIKQIEMQIPCDSLPIKKQLPPKPTRIFTIKSNYLKILKE